MIPEMPFQTKLSYVTNICQVWFIVLLIIFPEDDFSMQLVFCFVLLVYLT